MVIPKTVRAFIMLYSIKFIGGGMGGGQGAMAHLKFEGGGATYTLAPLEFWPNFD